jgi:hypothetical protein
VMLYFNKCFRNLVDWPSVPEAVDIRLRDVNVRYVDQKEAYTRGTDFVAKSAFCSLLALIPSD